MKMEQRSGIEKAEFEFYACKLKIWHENRTKIRIEKAEFEFCCLGSKQYLSGF